MEASECSRCVHDRARWSAGPVGCDMCKAKHGALTAGIADELGRLVGDAGSERIYHDHVGAHSERLWAHLGSEPHAWSNLSGVDVLLGDAESGKAILVLEVEETACPPKKLLGDVCALALSEYVTTESDNLRYAITPETEVWVCFPVNPHGHQLERDARVLERLRAEWGGKLSGRVRLVTSDKRDSLAVTVCDALREWFGRRRDVGRAPISMGRSAPLDGAASR